ncbi:MAG TPA: GNAT family N-acetyltransferase [Bacteroidales bacterium]|nr:GNAT family N-acetyltransferase [Bacteroidales bacterium]
MPIRLERSQSEGELLALKNLYENSFPPEERREHSQLVVLLSNPSCHINHVYHNDVLAGLITFWHFNEFVYVEHFAILPHFRDKGVGKEVVRKFLSSIIKPVLIEVEPPADYQGKRRVKFYSNLGFTLLDRVYVQPSYDGVKPQVELRLMCTLGNLSTSVLDKWIDELMQGVYFGTVNNGSRT